MMKTGARSTVMALPTTLKALSNEAIKKFDFVLYRPFDSHIMISAYFAICCDVHSNPENTSSDRRLIHYTREQLLSFNNGASNINDIGFHGLLRLHNSLLLVGYLSPSYGNVNDVGTNQISDLMDVFKKPYSNIQRIYYGSNQLHLQNRPL